MTCPYWFYFLAFIPSSIEYSIVFGFVYISSHICFQIWKLKNNAITKLFHKAFIKCIRLLYSDQVQSHKQALQICWTQKGPNLDQKRPKMGRDKFFRTVNLNFPKEDHKISFYTNKYAKLWFPAFIIWNLFYFSFLSYLHMVFILI